MTEEIKEVENGDGVIKADFYFECPHCSKRLCDNTVDKEKLNLSIFERVDSVDFNDGKRWCKYCGGPFRIILKFEKREVSE